MALGWREQYLRYKEFYLNIQTLYKQRADLRAFTEVILSLTTIIIFLNFALKPTAITIINLIGEIRAKQETIASLDQKINNLQTAQTLLTKNQNVLGDIDTAVGNSPLPDVISQQVEALAAKDSVTILGISVGQVDLVGSSQIRVDNTVSPLPDNAKAMAISVSIKGDYSSLSTFIKDFENLRSITKIDTTGISASTSDKGQVIVAVISGRVPYLGN